MENSPAENKIFRQRSERMAVTSNMANRLLSECATNPLKANFSLFLMFLKANHPLTRVVYQYEGISLDFHGFDSIDKEMQSLNTGNVAHISKKCKPRSENSIYSVKI
jgi:hypothetical protein